MLCMAIFNNVNNQQQRGNKMRSVMTEFQKNVITNDMNVLVVILNQKADALEKCYEDGGSELVKNLYYQRAVQRLSGFEQALACMGVMVDVHYTEPQEGKIQRVSGWNFI